MKELAATVERIQQIVGQIAAAKAAPEEARKELDGAVIGHKKWDGYGLREIRGKDLHERAVAAVTDYLIEDLTERKRAELKALADELDVLRIKVAELAAEARFELLDIVLKARTW